MADKQPRSALLHKLALVAGAVAGTIALPRLIGLLSASLPRAWAGFRPWLAPPYLFLAVHLIILLIWKLSDDRHAKRTGDPPEGVAGVAPYIVRTRSPKQTFTVAASMNFSDAYVDADNSGESLDAGGPTAPPQRPRRDRSVTEAKKEPADSDAAAAGDSIDATWKAIMQRSSSRRDESLMAAAAAAAARAESTEPEEMNRRFDDFIKKSRDQFMGRQPPQH